MADDPVEAYLTNDLCDDCKYWVECDMAREDTCFKQHDALTHYRRQKEELATTKLKIEKVTEVNTDYHNSWSKMGVELLKLKAELAQVKSDNAFIKEALQASNLDADAYFEMSEKIASLRADKERAEAELAQVKVERDHYKSILEYRKEMK